MDLDALRAAVERTNAAGPRAQVSWPDPHPDREVADQEYSRVTDPERYRIVGARVDAWVETLVALEAATAERTDAGVWLRPRASGAQPLLLEVDELEGVPGCLVRLSAGDPPRSLGYGQPDCGCDACDSGSADLLTAIDEEILAVVGGGFVHAYGPGWELRTTLHGWSASGLEMPSRERTEALIARVQAGDQVPGAIYGEAWLSRSR